MIRKTILFISIITMFFHLGCGSYDQISVDLQEQYKDSDNRLEAINGTYILTPPDIVSIYVSDNPDLTTNAMIRPDGNIFFPLLGDIYIDGLTPLEVREKIHKLLGRYLKELPEEAVSVQVTGFNSKKVYVNSYGGGIVQVPFSGDLTVLDAIAKSALLTRRVKQRGITVIRGESDTVETPQKLSVNLKDITNKGKTERNIVLRPNDVVYLPPTILGWLGYKLRDLLNPMQPVRQLGQTAASYQYNQLGYGGGRVGGMGGGGLGGSGSGSGGSGRGF